MEKTLKRQLLIKELAPGVRQVQNIRKNNTDSQYIELQVLELDNGAMYQEAGNEPEVCIVVLTSKINAKVDDKWYGNLSKRTSVFEKIPTGSVYIPAKASFELIATSAIVRLALCYSPTRKTSPMHVIIAEENTVEKRRIYRNKRLVHNILPDNVDTASSLLVVEAYIEGGNFSSYPPHKHNQENLPDESYLEKTYYHELNPEQRFAFQQVYTGDGSIDETMTAEHQNVAEIPKGYHPVGVPDGYTSYYLNVMAGPERIWKFHNEKKHEWTLNRNELTNN